jgi:hypothetical protein
MAKKPERKTRPTSVDPEDFLSEIEDEQRRLDSLEVLGMMKSVSRLKPQMWGPSIVGFGSKPIKYANGSELDWPLMAFSPRKSSLTLYLQSFPKYEELLEELGPHSASKACLYIKRLSEIDKKVLKQLIAESFKAAKRA